MAKVFETVAHDSAHGRWLLVRASPDRALAGDVREYQGYRESRAASVVRRATPVAAAPVIIVLDATFRLGEADGGWRRLGRSFVAGLHDRPALVGSGGDAWCMQFDLTPFGARRLFGVDLGALRNRVVELEDLIGPEAGRLADRLASAQGWPARFELLDGWLLARLGAAPAIAAPIAAAWRALRRSGGAAPVGALADAVGLTRQALALGFEREVGLSPKRAARVLRLERALAALARPEARLAELALDCGYYDQAHLCRELRVLCGQSPGEIRARLLPDGTGLMEDAA